MQARLYAFKVMSMLSKVELEYLKAPEKFDAAYSRVLKCRIKAKSAHMQEEAMLLKGAGLSVTENCNAVTDFSNANQSSNQALNAKWMAGPLGFEPRTSGSAGRCHNPY